MSAPGKRCDVEGCRKTARVEVYLATGDDASSVGRAGIRTDELDVCTEHAEKLGAIGDATYGPFVIVDPERAVGWRITIDVRPSGRWVVFMVEPS